MSDPFIDVNGQTDRCNGAFIDVNGQTDQRNGPFIDDKQTNVTTHLQMWMDRLM